jgi:hypothetical protein
VLTLRTPMSSRRDCIIKLALQLRSIITRARIAQVVLWAAIISNGPVSAAERSPTAAEMQKFKYSVWAKFCTKGNLARAGVCVTTMDVRIRSRISSP